MRARLLNLFPMIWLLAFPASRCAGYEFTVEGEVKIHFYDKGGQLERITNYNFTAEVRDCCSRIRVMGGYYAGVEFGEYGWDLTNSYRFVKFGTNQLPILGKANTSSDQPKAINDAVLGVYSTEPPQYGHGMEPVWLAYASACYYEKRVSGNKSEPVWRMGYRVREANVLFRSQWQLNLAAPRLLESMTDFTDGMKYAELSGGHTVRMPEPFDAETTNSVYRTLSWTNVSGLALPDKFQVILYAPALDAQTPTLIVKRTYEGVAHTIRPICTNADFSPNATALIPTQIQDNRLAHDAIPVAPIVYFSPSGSIAKLEELKKSDAYTSAQKRSTLNAKANSLRPKLIGLFVLASILPVWIFCRKKWWR